MHGSEDGRGYFKVLSGDEVSEASFGRGCLPGKAIVQKGLLLPMPQYVCLAVNTAVVSQGAGLAIGFMR